MLIVEAARTPIGAFLGGLSRTTATELGTVAAVEALSRAKVPAADVDAVYFGNVIPSSKDAAYLARHVALDAGVPVDVPAMTVNRACASGMDALILAAKDLRLGEAQVVLAGGAENMSMVPYAMRGVRQGWKMIRSQVDDMLFSTLHDPKAGCSIGETVEHLAGLCGITREEADEVAVWGQQRAAEARQAGRLAEQIVPVPVRRGSVEADECLRPDSTVDALAKLPGLYGGVITAGNSCGLNDAAAAMVLASDDYVQQHTLTPLGRVVSWAAVGVPPLEMGLGPVTASQLALKRAGLTLADIDVIELNDSFSVQYVAVEKALGLDRAKVNVNGGAIALGHPMAATGTRLVQSALYELRRRGGGRALCTLCVGGGQGVAMVVQSD